MRLRAPLGIVALAAAAPLALAEWVHPFDAAQPREFPHQILAVVEIPAASHVKYEIDEESGHVKVDRFVSMPVAYPANYGAIPQTHAGDGDNLDVLVITRTPLDPGVLIRVRPIGILKLLDGGDVDDKVVAVPVSKVDPAYASVREVSDLPAIEKERIEAFFRVYKELPEGSKKIELKGWADAEEARRRLRATHERYVAKRVPIERRRR